MKVTSARFVKSALKKGDLPRDHFGEVAFIGRSNVGKSRLLNALVNVGGLARISSLPGRTQTINFYLINDRFYFVDLPGYGYAKAPKSVVSGWGQKVESYLKERTQLKLVLLLIDSRILPTQNDIAMKNWLDYHNINNAVVLTKTDKLSRNQLTKSIKRASQELGTDELIPFSAVTRLGKANILQRIHSEIL